MSEFISISLDTGLYNAGIIGFINFLEKAGAVAEKDYFIKDQHIEVKKDFFLREDLAELYLDMIFEKYKDTDRFGKILEIDFLNADNNVLESYDKLFKNKTARTICETYNDTDFVPLIDEYNNISKNDLDAKRQKGNEIKKYLLNNQDIYKKIVIGHATREELGEFFDSMAYLVLSQGNKSLKKNTPFKEALNEFIFDRLKEFFNDYENYLTNNKYQCLQCRDISLPEKEKELLIDMKFLVDFVDDPKRKQSPFWDYNQDSHLCPLCAFIYMLMPFGFVDIAGRNFKKDKLFINDNSSIKRLRSVNNTYQSRKPDEDLDRFKIFSQIIQEELEAKQKYELNNIELIIREVQDKRSYYSYAVLGKDVLEVIRDSQNHLKNLVGTRIKLSSGDFLDVFLYVINNIVNNANQWNLMQILLRASDSSEQFINFIVSNIFNVQIIQNLKKETNYNKVK